MEQRRKCKQKTKEMGEQQQSWRSKNTKSIKCLIQESKNVQGVDDDNMFYIMPFLQDMDTNMILTDLEIPKDFSILQSSDTWIDGTAHKKGMVNLGKTNHPQVC